MDQREPYQKTILVLSIVIPLAVAILFRVKVEGYDLRFLPSIYASINGLTAILLVAAVIFIRKGNRKVHQRLMTTCVALSAMFLVLYVLYHVTTPSTVYGGSGAMKYFYYVILITHIILSVVITPLVLYTFSRGLGGHFERHKALAKFTFPIWLYVAVSGVVVYIMVSPYYA